MTAAIDEIKRDPVRREAALNQARTRLARLVQHPEFVEEVRADIRLGLHEKQREVYDPIIAGGSARFFACECGRRGGKTTLDAALAVGEMLDAKRGQEVVFCAPTLARGKELVWHMLEDQVIRYGLDLVWKLYAATGKVFNHFGAMFRIVGLDDRRQADKVARGGNTILFIADEIQEYAHRIKPLLTAASPALVQRRGAFVATGTPAVNDADEWAQLCEGAMGFSYFHWNLRDNPFLGRDPEEVLSEERERNGWDEDHPIYVREYLGKRCRDARLMVLEIGSHNLVREIQDYNPDAWALPHEARWHKMRRRWVHFLAVDFGSDDPTAWTVLASCVYDRRCYAVHFEEESGLTWDEVAERSRVLVQRYNPIGFVGDSASGGKQFIDTFNVRYGADAGVWAKHADKHDKKTSIDVWNTELRTGRFAWYLPAAEESYRKCAALQFEDESREEIVESPAMPHDPFDSCRYGVNEFMSWIEENQGIVDAEEAHRARRNAEAAASGHVRR